MASSPDSELQPDSSINPNVTDAVPSLLPPITSPPAPTTSSPPPPADSPPPTPSTPPPTAKTEAPPPSPPVSPPPSPPAATPPTPAAVASPPPASSPPPPAADAPTQTSPIIVPSSPPPSSPTPSPPVSPGSPPASPGSPPVSPGSPPVSPGSPPVTPDSPPASALPPSTPAFTSPPPVDPSSPPVPPSSTTSPPAPPTGSSPTVPSPKTPSDSGTPSSHGAVSSTPRATSPPDNNDQAVRTGVAIGVVAAVVIIGFMMAVLFVQRRKKKHNRYNSVYMLPSPYNSSQASGSSFMKANSTGGGDYMSSPPDTGGLGNSKSWFSYEELTTATSGFASQNILGAGGFGCVYKGLLQDGREVAVKKLKDNSGQGDREFKAEVEIISRVHHRYLVSLVGYCITDYQRLLVYEFVPNGTLHHHLHSSSKPPMEWSLRVRVACGSARGIAYLHEDCHPRIIHRDIKSANILVDNNFDAKVADFGLAKLAQELESNTHISTRVMGTFGYMAPEYASSGKLTEKSDVFSYGVVLLEIITGRKPVDETRPLGDESLVEWARPLMTEALDKENFDELADPRLEGNYDRGEMFRLIEAAAACVRHSAVKRPKMSQVVRALDTMSELSDLSNGMKPGQSGIFDSREQSAQIRIFQRMAFGSQEFSSDYQNTQGSWTSGQVGGRSGQV